VPPRGPTAPTQKVFTGQLAPSCIEPEVGPGFDEEPDRSVVRGPMGWVPWSAAGAASSYTFIHSFQDSGVPIFRCMIDSRMEASLLAC
jgi:hypothetical protein